MMEPDLLAAAISAAGVALTIPFIKRVAVKTGHVAHPKIDRWHTRSVPLLGGVGLFVGVLLALAVDSIGKPLIPIVIVASGMFVVGLIDDARKLRPSTKLIGQIIVAAAAVLVPFGWGTPDSLGVIPAGLRVLWIVGIANAVNLLDNMDGLCAGVAAIASFACWMGLLGASTGLSTYAAALFGATAAFLFFNFRPASIFMGDAGSLFLGGSLAVLSLGVGTQISPHGVAWRVGVPVFLLLIPIFDTAFVVLSRVLSTRSASQGGRDHTSHRLVAMGFSESQAVLTLWMLAAAGGAVAVAGLNVRSPATVLVAPLLLVALALFGIQLAKVVVYEGEDFSLLVGKRYTDLLVDVTYKRRVFEILLDVLLISLAYCAAYVIRFDRDVPQYYGLIRESLPLIVLSQIAALFLVGVYRGTWRHVSLSDLTTYAKGIGLGVLASVMLLVYLYRFEGYSRGVFIIDGMLLALVIPGARLSFRLIDDAAGRRRQSGKATLVYGAGDAGALLVAELRNNPGHGLHPVAFADDDASKWGKRLLRLRIVGGIDDVERTIAREGIEVVVLSTAKVEPSRAEALAAICHASGTRLLHLRLALQESAPLDNVKQV